MVQAFLPHRFDRRVWRAMRYLAPAVLAVRDRIARVSVAPGDVARLAALRGRAALLLPNHPSETDPGVVATVAYRVGEPFYFVATREMFLGVVGWIVRRMGVFSIQRGRPDRASLRAAGEILASGRKLVVFPEGETHLRHEAILPLHRGAAQLALWEMDRQRAAGESPRLALVPLVVTYRYRGDPAPVLTRGIRELETALGLGAEPASEAERLRRAALAVLEGIEREYGLGAAPASLEERIARVGAYIETRVCVAIGGGPALGESAPLRMRHLFNRVFDFRDALERGRDAYTRRLDRRRHALADALLADLWRYQNFMAMDAGVLPECPTWGQVGQLLSHLEIEVFGGIRTRPWRIARVTVGDPLTMEAPTEGRKAALGRITAELQARLERLLAEELDGL